MSAGHRLILEVLSGPLDGTLLTLTAGADWSRGGEGPLAFPWDTELGEPQARFSVDDEGWGLEGLDAPHGTYRVNQRERVEARVPLAAGDLLKASGTWLLVRQFVSSQ